MSASYKIGLGIAAALTLVVVIYFSAQDGPPPIDDGLATPAPAETGNTPATARVEETPPAEPEPSLPQEHEAAGGNTALMDQIRQRMNQETATADTASPSSPGTAADATSSTATADAPPAADNTVAYTFEKGDDPVAIQTQTTPPPAPVDTTPAETVTAAAPASNTTTATTVTAPRATTYTVRAGDNYFKISESQYGSDRYWQDIEKANPTVDPSRLKIGQVLNLPSLEQIQAGQPEPAPAPTGATTHTIKPGENLSLIAEQHYGDPNAWRIIFNANRDRIGPNPDRLQAGEKLVIPPAPSQ